MKKKEICKLENSYFKIEYDLTKGMWDCYKNGKIFIKNAYGEIDSREKIITTMDQGYERRYETKKIFDNVGPGEVLEIIHIGNNDLPEFKLSIVLYQEKQLLVLRTKVSNWTKYDMDILEICPIKVSYKTQGSLFFGDPKRCKVLQNVFWMGSPDQLTKPIVSKCKIRCWWSTGICNTETNEGFIAGVFGPANNETAIIVGYDGQSSKRGIEFSITGGCYTDRGPGSFKEGGNKERRPLILKVNRSFSMSEIVLLTDKHILDGLEKYADYLRDYNQIKLWPKPVTGFFTAYSVDEENKIWHNLNEENVHRVVEFLSKTLLKYGLEYIKIELGLAGSPNIFDPFAVNMEHIGGYKLEEHFPKGIPALIEGIHKLGFKTAWQSRTFLYVKGSEPNEMEKTRKIYDIAIRKWGFDYLMLDFNSSDAETISQSRPLMEVIKDRFAAIRRTVGRDIFIEGCMNAWAPMVGLVNGYRPTFDFRAGLEDKLLKGFASRYYLHGRVFYNDAEFLDVSEKPFPPQLGIGGGPEKTLRYSFEETKTWASLVGIAGLSLFAGGYLPAAPEERLEILKKLLPVYDRGARPLDLFERDLPQIWDLQIDENFDSWHVVGLFNWDYEKEEEVKVDFEKCGLEKSSGYLLFDFWGKRFLGERKGSFSKKLAPRHCTIISIHTKANRPQLLSTTRHITQGGIEIMDMKWDNRTNTLSGTSIGPKETSHNLFIYVPTKYRLKNNLGVEIEGMENAILQIRLKFNASERIEWIITFSTS